MNSIAAIAQEINSAAHHYKMGELQEIRRQIHQRTRAKDHRIFTSQTIRENWAFHLGGRTELQFNIGFEGEDRAWFRYGVAFSLEPSHTLPKPLILKPKILKLSDYLATHAAQFEDLRFWYHGDERSPTLPVGPVPVESIAVGAFLFWGKLCSRDEADPDTVLFLFDRLLEIYRYVEGDQKVAPPRTDLRKGFTFRPGCTLKPDATTAHSAKTTKTVALRHNTLQSALHKALSSQYGEKNVGAENDTGRGSRIDLVVRDGTRHIYYEIKPYPSIIACIREALGQLLEYSYWPGGNPADHVVIVSENPLTPDAARYLNTLRTKFTLPVYYQRLDMSTGSLQQQQ